MKLKRLLQFFAQGIPAPGGSKTGFVPRYKDGTPVTVKGRIVVNMVDAGGARNKEWRKLVGWAAKKAMIDARIEAPFNEALVVLMEFLIKRPANQFGSKGGVPYLRADAPVHHIIAPDALKFARSTEDAMTGIVWSDDAVNITNIQSKRYAGPNENPGCCIAIFRPIMQAGEQQDLLALLEELPLG